MRGEPKITVTDISFHRNGISGEGFHAVLFDWKDDGTLRHMIASVFDGPGQVACYDVQQLVQANIAFACGNSWRGDHFEGLLRKAIEDAPSNRIGPFAFPQSPKSAA